MDFYQLTMAQAYWKAGIADTRACFQMSFRRAPFKGQYALACGLEMVLELIEQFHFSDADLKFLASQSTFTPEFLNYLSTLRIRCDIDAMPEGTVAFVNEPLLRVTGSILQAQLLETAILNIMNFQSLIATKAARIKQAAGDDEVMEFGLRRAHGFDGGISASRAAYLGGCDSTSHVFAAQKFGIPLRGTMAHSWVMAFDSEAAAFATYAEVAPHNCVLLVDTYDTITGVKNAIRVGKQLESRGHRLLGIRLDSGNLLELSTAARQMLDEAGLRRTQIIASGDLDEYRIAELKRAGAPINAWGVGTKLVTAYDDPALGGVYKLAAIEQDGKWRPCAKISNDVAKRSLPGILPVYRHPKHDEDIVVPMMRSGARLHVSPSLADIRKRIVEQLKLTR